jgi:Kae1-associated kinase Bud32
MKKAIAQGAEAIITKQKNFIIKNRISKSYRIKELDNKIRKRRTKKEIKLLLKASKIINSPKPEQQKNFDKIKMPFISGKKLSENLDKFSLKKQKQICNQIGTSIAKSAVVTCFESKIPIVSNDCKLFISTKSSELNFAVTDCAL